MHIQARHQGVDLTPEFKGVQLSISDDLCRVCGQACEQGWGQPALE